MRITVSVISASCLIAAIIAAGCSPRRTVHGHHCIAHAGGAIEGCTYTNSKEAVEHALGCGIRYIELDLAMTSDSTLAAVHDWAEFRRMADIQPLDGGPLGSAQFAEAKICGRFTPLTAEGIVGLLDRHPEMILVTDKISDPQIIGRHFDRYAGRVIVECFSDSDYYELSRAGYTCFRSATPQFFGLYYIKKLLRFPQPYIDRYVTEFGYYDLKFRRWAGFFPPPRCEAALFTAKDRAEADKIFALYPNVSLVYTDDIEPR